MRAFRFIFAPLVIVTLIMSSVILMPKKVQAAPVEITGASPAYYAPFVPLLASIQAATAAETSHSFFKWAQTFVLEALKKRILDMIVAEIINWVQGNGDPQFVTDWQGFLQDAGNVALGDLAVKVGGAGLCQPFRAGTLASLQIPTNLNDDLYGSPITCTLDDIVDNIEGFYDDFSNGGWEAYVSSWQPENNPLAVYIMVGNTKAVTVSGAANAALLEAQAGNGFLSQKSCTEDPTSNGPDIDRDGKRGDIASKCRITTPGTTIGNLVSKAVGSDIDFLVNSQQLATYVAEISDALFNRLIRDGVSGLAGLSTKAKPNNKGYIPEGATGCAALITPELMSACDGYFSSNSANFNATRATLVKSLDTVRVDLVELRDALFEWGAVANDLNIFVATESPKHSTRCVSAALDHYLSDPTPQGVAALLADISIQLHSATIRIELVDTYLSQLNAIAENKWAEFTVLAATIEGDLQNLAVPNGATNDAIARKGELKVASEENIQPDINRCSSL